MQIAVFRLCINDTFQSPAISCLCPRVEIVDDGLIINCHIEDAHTFIVVVDSTTFAVPRFYEIHLYMIVTVRNGDVVP